MVLRRGGSDGFLARSEEEQSGKHTKRVVKETDLLQGGRRTSKSDAQKGGRLFSEK